jgi:branched-chain amino acid transport system ATP-binding protein
VAIIGPNGAGKTTAINVMTGIYAPYQGDVRFRGSTLIGLKPFQITALGIARTFQQAQLFSNMTVLENVMAGRHCRMKSGFLGGFLHHRWERREESAAEGKAREILDSFGLSSKADWPAPHIPIRDQRRLEIARAMASEPALLLLDEPAAGLNIRETEEIAELIQRLNREGQTVVLVEHNMHLVMSISDWVIVLHHGRKIGEGPPDEVQRNTAVVEAYLGQ